MNVCVVGMGYIGFPTACIIAEAGHDVVGVEVNEDTLFVLNNGDVHIKNEAGLYELSQQVMQSGKLKVQTKPEKADVFIIAVPTPCRKCEDNILRRADVSYIEKAVQNIMPFLEKGNLIVLESTVPPGTTEKVVGDRLVQEGYIVGEDIFLAFAPERVLPGNLMAELTQNDRIIGGVTPESATLARDFYTTFIKGNIYLCNARTAEMAKLLENTYRDVNIALANELALLAEKAGVNAYEAIELANNHPRVNILKPGPGVGGHCIAEDPYFLIAISPELSPLLQVARNINADMPHHVLKLFQELPNLSSIEKVVILGSSYKANVGDERNSPGLQIAGMIRELGKDVVVHDPFVPGYDYNIEKALNGADVLILVTDHDEYKEKLETIVVAKLVNSHIIIDTRGFFGNEWDRHFQMVRLGVGGKNSD